MKRAFVIVACISVLGGACSSSAENSSASSLPASTASSASPIVSAASSIAGATTDTLTPEVVCTRFDGAVFFAYESGAADPVRVSDDRSVLVGGLAGDNPFVPTLFAPGRVSPAFYAYPDGDAPLTWTVVGPDGVSRSATPADEPVECTDELLASTPPGTRTPSIEVTSATVSDDGKSVTIEAVVVGVPELSVCSGSLTAEPVAITMNDGNAGPTTDGSTFTATSELFSWETKPGLNAPFTVAAYVVDACSANGGAYVQRSWPGGEFERMRNGLTVCVNVADGVATTETFYDRNCGNLPPTGGARVRPG